MPDDLVLGMDVGGTATRAVVVDLTGRLRGRGNAGGGNPVSHSADHALLSVRTASCQALGDVDARRIRAVVVGIAGGNLLRDPVLAAPFEQAWRDLGLCCPVKRIGDVQVAFAAGTAEPDGTVLIAGTGAVAAEVRNRVSVTSIDGYGWLLGDLGSGFWLGRQAVCAALAELDGRGPRTRLTGLVIQEMLGRKVSQSQPKQIIHGLVFASHAQPPVTLARLAPLVSRAADAGDQVALGLVSAAVEHLVGDVQAVRPPDAATPLIVAGAVATGATVLGNALRSRLAAMWPGALRHAGDGASAAAWLAARELPEVDDEAAERLHERILAASPRLAE